MAPKPKPIVRKMPPQKRMPVGMPKTMPPRPPAGGRMSSLMVKRPRGM